MIIVAKTKNAVHLTLLFLFPSISFSTNETTTVVTEKAEELIKACRERDRLTGSEKEDYYSIIDVPVGRTVALQCHFCNENDDKQPKIWYKQDKLYNNTAEEVELGMENNISLSRIHVNIEHTLFIKNTTVEDTGLYLCQGEEDQESEYKFNFYLNFVYDAIRPEEVGDEEVWRKYHDENFYPINKLFRGSGSPEFVRIREALGLTVQLYTEWDPWSTCDACGRPKDKGIMKRYGHCRLKIIPISKKALKEISLTDDERTFVTIDRISCRSLLVSDIFPYIGNLTKVLPDFQETKYCKGTCRTDDASKGWLVGKTKDYKYRKTYVLVQGTHLTIICPESSLENNIVWKRNGMVLPRGDSIPPPTPEDEPHITVDTFSTLYLREVTIEEEGNYTCQVDDIRMQLVRVFVVSKSRLLTQALVRHLIYLGFVLSLTVSCYCAGLVVVWKNRNNFKTYEELKEENVKKMKWKRERHLYSVEEGEGLEAFLKEGKTKTESKHKTKSKSTHSSSPRGVDASSAESAPLIQ